MKFIPSKLNTFLFFKLPSAFWCGVRVKDVSANSCTVSVRHKWFNQNPFNSMYFAVQAMAAELSTGVLVMYHIHNSNRKISMLVTGNSATYIKKARGRITFACNQGVVVRDAISAAIATGQGQVFRLQSIGMDEAGDKVSVMEFEWSVKIK